MGETPVVVRSIDEGDWVSLRALRLEALADSPDSFGSTFADAVRQPDAHWRSFAATPRYVVGERDGRFLAMAMGRIDEKEPLDCWLYSMYVTPLERGTGLADALVDSVANYARESGCRRVVLDAVEDAQRAIAFYRRCGFAPTGRRMRMTRDPSIELIEFELRLARA